MVVPLRDHRENDAWIFLKPLTPELWCVIGAFFFFTGAIVWILEHRVNEDFRGAPGHQLGTALYFIFSTLVFSHSSVTLRRFHITLNSWISCLSLIKIDQVKKKIVKFPAVAAYTGFVAVSNQSSGHESVFV